MWLPCCPATCVYSDAAIQWQASIYPSMAEFETYMLRRGNTSRRCQRLEFIKLCQLPYICLHIEDMGARDQLSLETVIECLHHFFSMKVQRSIRYRYLKIFYGPCRDLLTTGITEWINGTVSLLAARGFVPSLCCPCSKTASFKSNTWLACPRVWPFTRIPRLPSSGRSTSKTFVIKYRKPILNHLI